ncbi:HlyU family transcriptional regulator [Thalassobacter stenotrophicus]|uniref:Transcriptional activator HlyU n=2 Tax=Thalassobacter stenotrophicus TaxID=266809 RepID=A0A0P1F386_9RHOB|nr:HlyU family transcriptional regulator [Thalassobacter stenotrophicus]PVZ48915.1 hypothetical protein DD557_09335 [Thalassobacter stenotrophicus]CUH62110.1 hypothetical protein THS5294_03424 [Thalassobacter stenotrophicus]SHI34644.1 hypothetical protein SAMN02744035_00208 [Thalassobacter stenotrophicus DSM 16310]
MSLLSKLFGKSEQKPAEPVMYEGFAITPQPMKEGHVYRLSAIIEKDGQSHHLIRADTLPSVEAAHEAAIEKAKQVIDQQGARMF